MHRIKTAILIIVFVVTFFACKTTAHYTAPIYAVQPGRTLNTMSGYLAIGFANEAALFKVGSKNVYLELCRMITGKSVYIPLSAGEKLRLISLPAGTYKIKSFLYEAGTGSVQSDSVPQSGVLDEKPARQGMYLEKAAYAAELNQEFKINAGEILYIGDFAWKVKLAIGKAAVTINRSVRTDELVLAALQEDFSTLPEQLKLVSLPE
jgi:hypothetical protein